jgi:hypothetical protein
MEISEFVFRIILLFIPGFIVNLVISYLTTQKDEETDEKLLKSLMFGFICYFLFYLLTLFKSFNLEFTLLKDLDGNVNEINFQAIFITSLLALPVGIFLSFLIKTRIIYELFNELGFNKASSQDVWLTTLDEPSIQWIRIRDIPNNLIYEGAIRLYSGDAEKIELLINDVNVYRNTDGAQLYTVPKLYLCMKKEELVIELF